MAYSGESQLVSPPGLGRVRDSEAERSGDGAEPTSPVPGSIRQLRALAAAPAGKAAFAYGGLPVLPPQPPGSSGPSGGSALALAEAGAGSGAPPWLLPPDPGSLGLSPGPPNAGGVGLGAKYTGGEVEGLPGVEEGHIAQAFREIDFDGNGFIGVSELRYLLIVMGERPTDDELDEMMRMVDVTGDGQIAYEDFLQLFAPGHAVLLEMASMAPEELCEEEEDDDDQSESDPGTPTKRDLVLLERGMAAIQHALHKNKEARSEAESPKRTSPRSPLPASRRQAKREKKEREEARRAAAQKSLLKRAFGPSPRKGFGAMAAGGKGRGKLGAGGAAPLAPFGAHLPRSAQHTPMSPISPHSMPSSGLPGIDAIPNFGGPNMGRRASMVGGKGNLELLSRTDSIMENTAMGKRGTSTLMG